MARRNAICIVVADLHLREDQPEAWTTPYFEAQQKTVASLQQLVSDWHVPVLVAGDIFHHWKPSPFLLRWAMEALPNDMIVIPGQHDLPQHNLDLYNKSGLSVMEKAGKMTVLTPSETAIVEGSDFRVIGFPFGTPLREASPGEMVGAAGTIALCHVMTYTGRKPWPGCEELSCGGLMKLLKGFSWIITGDNHQTFTVETGKQTLINPGSLMQMRADQMDHEPSAFILFEDGGYVKHLLPDHRASLSREHLEKAAERDKRIEAFVTRLEEGAEVGLSFEDNLKDFMSKNRTRKAVRELIAECIEGGAK